MTLEVTILGCGSSSGVPRVGRDGPDWGACDPNEPKNWRTRCSILVKHSHGTVLIDTSPDLRMQLIRAGTGRIDAVLITHDHADQIHGIDDLRAIAYANRRRLPVYADRLTMATLHQRFGYCFETPPGSPYPPILEARLIEDPLAPFTIPSSKGGIPVTPFAQQHGSIRSLGYRIGGLAYSSDVNALSEESFAVLAGVKCWILDALRYQPHPTHSHVEQSLAWIARVKPAHAVLTNMHVDIDYQTLRQNLPEGVEPAFDGLSFAVAQ
jgi:phosphoribosyl 1,2-cyclic phosphate phosphodiesterase